ncbi:MAG: hypothetical protein ABUS76_00575 [Candidatus Shikimatogenerans sp. Ttur]|uniref:Pseudouridine synthase I TruA alpha/beta domain-containing protein n=1 Tax=Candidatus Shikimatogenerans sp. Ttur TaxID=3158569 RepID=A0AAU7ZY71_9FLAO
MYNKINFNKLLIITKIININNNFYSFTSNKYYNNNCYIKYIKWFFLKNNILIFYIKANRYLKYMIRCIIGIILKISLNKKNFFFFFKCFKKKKKFLKYLIPSYGLYLLNVEY